MKEIKSIRLKDLHSFPENPFHVEDDVGMDMLVESIKEYGVMSPIIVRHDVDGYACKYKTNVHEIKRRYCVNGLFAVEYETRQGRKSTTFYRDGYKRKEVATKFDNVSELPQFSKYAKTNTLKQRVERNCCELCGKRTKELEIHQVKKLKDLKGTADWVLTMRRMRRKTLVVCTECHQRIHSCNATMIGGEPYTSRGVRTVREGVDARPH